MGTVAVVIGMGVAVMSGAVVLAASQTDASGGLDIWTLLEKGGAPMAGLLFLALAEVYRQLQRCHKIIAAKDATILEMSNRQTSAIQTTNEIADHQMKTARNIESILHQLVTLLRGKLDIG